jgi:flagellar biosynthesis protein FlhB
MEEQDNDRSEQATPHKLQEARKKGSVSKSADFTATAILAGLMITIYGSGWDSLRQTLRAQQLLLSNSQQRQWDVDYVTAWLSEVFISVLVPLGPLFLTLTIVAILINLVQTGPIFSFHPLTPDLDRINPASGFKRLFSIRTPYEAAKSITKLIILTWVTYFTIRNEIPGLMTLSGADPKGYARVLIGLSGSLLVRLILVLFLLSCLDLAFTRWEFAKRMRMSLRDIKDESKNREGDPRIRSRIRELRQEMLKRSRSMQNLPNADVLITNPTHLAVALNYNHGHSGAPKVVAKGAGDLAAKMREIAFTHQIPIIQNKLLARTLFREVENDGYVPEKLYPQIAKIMVWVYAMKNRKIEQVRTRK